MQGKCMLEILHLTQVYGGFQQYEQYIHNLQYINGNSIILALYLTGERFY